MFNVLQMLRMIPGLENHRENMGADLCVHFAAGGLAGITAASVTYPLDLVRTRLAAQVISHLAGRKSYAFFYQFFPFSGFRFLSIDRYGLGTLLLFFMILFVVVSL